jgi:hypothetical protein
VERLREGSNGGDGGKWSSISEGKDLGTTQHLRARHGLVGILCKPLLVMHRKVNAPLVIGVRVTEFGN